jgi:serine/threonine protein kinase/5'-deoxynucleotidase YfbR-like HD superfamily hydrolase/3',5'-cyclic AMP phosphodiesterase CpdA
MRSPLLPPVQPPSRPRLTLLHLTDLHFARPNDQYPSAHYWNSREWPGLTQDRDYNQRGLLESILTDLSANDWRPDLVIVSGDLLDRGQRSGVELAIEFLTQFSQRLSLGPDRFVLVPGNHDEVKAARTADERYAHFSLIWKGFYAESRPWAPGRRAHEQVELFDLRAQLGVQIIGFNSCEGHDSDLHAGAVGTHQRELAEKLLERSGEAPFRIAVMHHHLYNPTGVREDMSVMEGASETRLWLKRHRFQLAIHGHQHVDWREEDSADDWTLSVVAGASAGVGRYGRLNGDIRLGYQIIGLEDERSGYRCRRWYDSPSRSFTAAGTVEREPLRFGPWPNRRGRTPRSVANRAQPASAREQSTASGTLPLALPPQYEHVEDLGEGSMGRAFKVRYLGLNEIRVMKVLDDRRASAAAARFFESESEALRSLKHDGFVKIHANERTASYRYTILEYAEGRNLHTVLNECQRLPLDKALLVMRKVVEALEHAHERGIIHCNLNPVNIVVDVEKTWDVRVVDLGAAHFLTAREGHPLAHRPRAPGLPGYTAPELEDPRQSPTVRSDLYSIGVILYELLLGRRPEGGSHPLRHALPERHWRVCDLVDRLLERDPDRRPSSASEVLKLLLDLETSLTRQEGRLSLSTRDAVPAAASSAEPQGSSKPRQPRRGPGSRANLSALEVNLGLLILQRHLPEHFRRSPSGPVAQYAGFFEFLVAHEPKTLASKGKPTLLERTAAMLEEFNQSLPLGIDGAAGTGKTAFLVALYWYLRKRRDGNPEAPIPLYLNLASYDARAYEGPPETHASQASDALREDLAPYLTLAGRQLKFIVIIDHLDDHGRFRRQLAELALSQLPVGKQLSLLVGHRLEQREGSYIRLANLLSFQGVSPRSRGFEVFVRQYAEAHGFMSQDVVQRVTQQLQDFKLEVLDSRMLWMLLSSSEYVRRPLSLSELHRWECTSYLEKHGARGEGFLGLQRPAELAFRYEVLRERETLPPEEAGSDRVSWNLLHEAQQTTRSFLVAVHIISTLRSAARGGKLPEGTYEILSYIYPWMITRFCRELITALDRDMHMIVDAAEAIFDQVPISKHAIMYFLLGRVDNRDSKTKASKLLKKQRQLLAGSELEPNIKKLLERTIEISLIVLNPKGDQGSQAPKVEDPRWQASQRYIKTLIQDPEADMLNRGFLLEYYGDHPFVPKREPVYQDDLAPCPRTFEKHYKHLEGAIARKANYPPLFELELFSLCSLAFHRHEAGCLPEPDRERILRLVTRILTSPRELRLEFLCPELMLYLQMIEKTLERRMFSSGVVIEDLYALKSELRQSWVQPESVGRTESVAEHMYGAFLLAWLYLPESPEYSKDRILRMLLLHDLNEAFTGDKLPGEKTNKDQAYATQWIEYLSMLGTHKALPGLTSLKEAWSEFAARTTVEGQIAKDFDNLDLLVQSFIYARRHHPPKQSLDEHEKLRDRITSEVKTPQGIRVREIITRHFDGEFSPLNRKLHPDD